MHLVANIAQKVRLAALDLDLEIAAGERIRTEISRKFTRASAEGLLTEAGFAMQRWFVSDDRYFALALAAVEGE